MEPDDMKKAGGKDPYEMFLGGPLSLVTIENKNAKKEKLSETIKNLVVSISSVEELFDENQIEQKIFSGAVCVVFENEALSAFVPLSEDFMFAATCPYSLSTL